MGYEIECSLPSLLRQHQQNQGSSARHTSIRDESKMEENYGDEDSSSDEEDDSDASCSYDSNSFQLTINRLRS